MGTESTRQALAAKGADSAYTVAPSADIGYGSFLLEITGVGNSPETAVRTAQLVGTELTRQLRSMQADQGVSPQYMIQAQNVVSPDHAKQKVSGKLRPLIGVLVIGAILLFVVISGAEALAAIRAEWSEAKRRETAGDAGSAQEAAGSESGLATARAARRPERRRAPGRRNNGRKPERETAGRQNGRAAAQRENGRAPAQRQNGRAPDRAEKDRAPERENGREPAGETAGSKPRPRRRRPPRARSAGKKA
jgi:hypothetical protein